jgi:hypothetical protein
MTTNRYSLALHKQSIRTLTPSELRVAHGGGGGGGRKACTSGPHRQG